MSEATIWDRPAVKIGIWAGRLITAGVFIYAAVPKLLDPATFAESIANYQAFPYWIWNFTAAVVPFAELLAALAVLTGYKRRAGALILGAMNLIFMGLILSVIVRDIDLACGCFGSPDAADPIGWADFVRDVGLMIAIVASGLGTGDGPERDAPASVDEPAA